jgi:hypothetical protein
VRFLRRFSEEPVNSSWVLSRTETLVPYVFDYHNLNRCTLIKTIKRLFIKGFIEGAFLKVKKKRSKEMEG